MIIGKTKVLSLVAVAMFCVIAPASAQTYYATLPAIDKVMAGASGGANGGSAQVWVRVVGQPSGVPAACVWTSYSLFYVADDSSVMRDHVLSLLMTAKVTNQPITLAFDVQSTSADFLGFGYTQCVIRRIVMG